MVLPIYCSDCASVSLLCISHVKMDHTGTHSARYLYVIPALQLYTISARLQIS